MPYTLATRVRYAIDGTPGMQEFRGTREERSIAMAAWMKKMRDQHGNAFEHGWGWAFADQWYPGIMEEPE